MEYISRNGGMQGSARTKAQLLTGITVELKAKAVRGRDKWLSESNLNVEASDSIATIRKKVVEIAA